MVPPSAGFAKPLPFNAMIEANGVHGRTPSLLPLGLCKPPEASRAPVAFRKGDL